MPPGNGTSNILAEFMSKASSIKNYEDYSQITDVTIVQHKQLFLGLNKQNFWSAEVDDWMNEVDEGNVRWCK